MVEDKPYIIWVDDGEGRGGYRPHWFDTVEEMSDWIIHSQSYGSNYIVTKIIKPEIAFKED